MTERRKITDADDARRCLAAARRAGERVGSWAQANGVDGRSLNAWRMNLARGRGGPRRSDRHGAVERGADSAAPPSAGELIPAPRPAAAARYVVLVGDVRIEVGDGFDVTTLRRLVGALRAC
jgi:hypothetical protein